MISETVEFGKLNPASYRRKFRKSESVLIVPTGALSAVIVEKMSTNISENAIIEPILTSFVTVTTV